MTREELTREVVIKYLQTYSKCKDCTNVCYDRHLDKECEVYTFRESVNFDDIIEYLIEALSEPTKTEPKWISVDERLPEDFQRVLVTLVNYNGDKVVRVAEYVGKQRIFQIKENRDIWEVGEKGLLAWRPLPEPYKAESEDKEWQI